MEIVVIGLNHKTTSVDVRERLSGFLTEKGPVPASTQEATGLMESLFLTTCNRVELLFTSEEPERTIRDLMQYWADGIQKSPSDLIPEIYVLRADGAIQHLFKVAAGLDSMVIGEPQILGQIKEAYQESVRNHTTGVILNRLLHKTFSVAKRIRTETGIGGLAVSVSFAAVELAKKIFQDLSGKRVLLIGAGEMAELAAEHLLNNRVQKFIVANRTLERAMELARRWQGQAISLDEIPSALFETDIVLSSTGAPEIIIDYSQVKSIMKQRKQRPLFFIDIAVPRDIDPGINELDNVYLYDIDDLQGVIQQNIAVRKQEALKAERIAQEEGLKFDAWLNGLDVVPTIISLRQKIEAIRQGEWKKAGSALEGLTPGQQKAIEQMTGSIINKILHAPISFLKEAGHEDHKGVKIDQIQKIFNLNDSNKGMEED
ncbi:MAG: glutamyl-tRNA reductase [Deltaproteobacteria bacterium]|nr:glutamyl-tRNA reductase [Deltaproteobacteria bacterium]